MIQCGLKGDPCLDVSECCGDDTKYDCLELPGAENATCCPSPISTAAAITRNAATAIVILSLPCAALKTEKIANGRKVTNAARDTATPPESVPTSKETEASVVDG